jgi:hypothetical protein
MACDATRNLFAVGSCSHVEFADPRERKPVMKVPAIEEGQGKCLSVGPRALHAPSAYACRMTVPPARRGKRKLYVCASDAGMYTCVRIYMHMRMHACLHTQVQMRSKL